MSVQQQQPDGSWAPAQPLGYQPGWDIERTAAGQWTLYRTIHHSSAEMAHGRTTIGMLLSYCWHRVLKSRSVATSS